jgi:hypothetical protein
MALQQSTERALQRGAASLLALTECVHERRVVLDGPVDLDHR